MASTADAGARLRQLDDERAALRRVARLAAEGASATELFGSAAGQIAEVLGVTAIALERIGPGPMAAVIAALNVAGEPGTSRPIASVVAVVVETGAPARGDDDCEAAAPIRVGGEIWGLVRVSTTGPGPLAAGVEHRLNDFAELIGIAVANAEARDRHLRLVEQETALRRVATLVAEDAPPEQVFDAVAAEVGNLLGASLTVLGRYDGDGAATAIGSWSSSPDTIPVGTRSELGGRNVLTMVHETGAPARLDDYDDATGTAAQIASRFGWRSSIAAPITVENRVWGVMLVATQREDPFPEAAEQRLAAFTDLVATAVGNAEAHSAVRVFADEQAALGRVATLVAAGAAREQVFAAVVDEASRLLGLERIELVRYAEDDTGVVLAASGDHPFLVGSTWSLDDPSVMAAVARTGRAARINAYAELEGAIARAARSADFCSAIGAPISVEGRLWGAIIAISTDPHPIPDWAETRLGQFTELIAIAVSNTQAREEVTTLAAEQAALRRVATLVARDEPSTTVFEAVASEVGELLEADFTALGRYDGGVATAIGSWSTGSDAMSSGTHAELGGHNVLTAVAETGRAARLDEYNDASGEAADIARGLGWHSSLAAPVVVEGRLWGVMLVARKKKEPFPAGAEARLAAFTELVGTAVANAQAHEAVRSYADEQAGLRRVATLVAGAAAPAAVIAAVTEEIGLVLGADSTLLFRADADGTVVVVGVHAENAPDIGTRTRRGGTNLSTIVLDTGRSARIDSYDSATGDAADLARSYGLRSAVGAPIHVEGRVWGLVLAGSTTDDPLPSDAEQRLVGFTELVATAVANAQAQGDLRGLADQQAALRRVATLVAGRVAPDTVFRAVAEEAGALLGADLAALVRLESDGTVTVMAEPPGGPHATGDRLPIDPRFVVHAVRETGLAARFETDDPGADGMPDLARDAGVRSAVASPIVVEEALWGAVVLGSLGASFPPGTEERLDEFTELVATAISNASTRAELVASRARLVTAGDEALRRVERDLHDGTQQRLLAIGLDLQRVRAAIPDDEQEARSELERVGDDVEAVVEEVRELSRGLHPAQLSRSGLGPALRALARRSPIDVELRVEVEERPAQAIETALYYVVSEGVANAIRHSGGSTISIAVVRAGDRMLATVADDGAGGAEPGHGSGLTGLRDRVEALGGTFALATSPGTTISVELPVAAP